MREHLTVRRYVLGVCGRTPKVKYRRSRRHVSDGVPSRSQALMDPADL